MSFFFFDGSSLQYNIPDAKERDKYSDIIYIYIFR